MSELETLERIDVELNRSLDLAKVAQISLHWAMENSGATAGLIGVVVDEPPRLDVIYRVGYDDDDLPTGVEGNLLAAGSRDRQPRAAHPSGGTRAGRAHRPELHAQPARGAQPDHAADALRR